MNWIYICYAEGSIPPLWSSGQSSWPQIQRSGFDYRHYQIFLEVVGLERGPLSLVSTTEELLDRKIEARGSCLEIREYGCRDPSCWPCGTLYPQELALDSPTSGDRTVGTVRSRTQATEFSSVLVVLHVRQPIQWHFLRTEIKLRRDKLTFLYFIFNNLKESCLCAKLINCYAMKAYGGGGASIHIFMTLALVGGDCQLHALLA
jgi:hypothetical protein